MAKHVRTNVAACQKLRLKIGSARNFISAWENTHLILHSQTQIICKTKMMLSIFNEKQKMIMDRSSNPRSSNVSSSSSTSSIKALGRYLSRMHPTPEAAHQSVVIIMDASREIDSSALFWPIECLNLKNGDSLKLLRIVHEIDVNTKNARNYKAEANLNKNMAWMYAKLVIEKEMKIKREECLKNVLVEVIRRECEYKRIQFDVEVRAGASSKVVALQAGREFKATWIVLDRSIKKDAKYFMENLVCFISKVTRNNKVKILRGNTSPNAKAGNGLLAERKTRSSGSDSLMESRESPDSVVFRSIYEETPAPVEERPEDLFSLEISPADQITFARDYYYKQRPPLISNIYQEADSNQDPESSAETLYFSDDDSNNGDTTEKVKTVTENFISNLKLPEGSLASPADPCSVCQYKSSLVVGQELIKYTYTEIAEATNNFSEENCLSRSGLRHVYKGRLKEGLYIAVKAHKHASFVQLRAEFECEVEGISRAQHKNLVMLLGYCSEDSNRYLVYEYICNGSLYSHLFGSDRKVLDWQERRNIAIGAARAFRYLHEECRGRQIVHGDLRLKKILLNHDLEPMVGDFGLTYKHSSSQKGVVSNDVYYFGVILLQLITGRKDFDHTLPPQQQHIVQWARPFITNYKHVEILDKRIKFPGDYDELNSMLHVATLCLCQNPFKRPSMSKVVHILEGKILSHINAIPQILDYSEPYRESCSYIRNNKHSWDSNSFDIKEICETKSTSLDVATTKLETIKRKKSESKLRRKPILSYDNMLT